MFKIFPSTCVCSNRINPSWIRRTKEKKLSEDYETEIQAEEIQYKVRVFLGSLELRIVPSLKED